MTTKYVPVLSQLASGLNLAWNEGDLIDLSAIVLERDWTGTYAAEVRTLSASTSTLLTTLTVTAVKGEWNDTLKTFTPGAGGTDTQIHFVADATESAKSPEGEHFWDLKRSTAGPLRKLSGRVKVGPKVTQ